MAATEKLYPHGLQSFASPDNRGRCTYARLTHAVGRFRVSGNIFLVILLGVSDFVERWSQSEACPNTAGTKWQQIHEWHAKAVP